MAGSFGEDYQWSRFCWSEDFAGILIGVDRIAGSVTEEGMLHRGTLIADSSAAKNETYNDDFHHATRTNSKALKL